MLEGMIQHIHELAQEIEKTGLTKLLADNKIVIGKCEQEIEKLESLLGIDKKKASNSYSSTDPNGPKLEQELKLHSNLMGIPFNYQLYNYFNENMKKAFPAWTLAKKLSDMKTEIIKIIKAKEALVPAPTKLTLGDIFTEDIFTVDKINQIFDFGTTPPKEPKSPLVGALETLKAKLSQLGQVLTDMVKIKS